eukprot:TRINITY_DN244_c0_g2_i5.p1 TRINITY_DN244_c0_g2~~TRINITY_DN244_c0_g2_i5.p1  ORF type:complete len:465 (+),score=-6.63 TRINITY_DN244_c0_g2_i5:1091-2485(+)
MQPLLSFLHNQDSEEQEGLPTHQQHNNEQEFLNRTSNDDNKHNTQFQISMNTMSITVGIGILGLPWAFSYLGMISGLSVLFLGFFIFLISSNSLLILHGQGESQFDTYYNLTRHFIGEGFQLVLLVLQTCSTASIVIAYPIVGGECMSHIYDIIFPELPQIELFWWIFFFGSIQSILSFLPRNVFDVYIKHIGGIISSGYSFCIIVLSVIHAVYDGNYVVNYNQRSSNNLTQILFTGIAIGVVLYAFQNLYATIEIQPTSTSTTRDFVSVRKGILSAQTFIIILYVIVSVTGYWVFGTSVSGNILISLSQPVWLATITSTLIFIHTLFLNQKYLTTLFIAMEQKFVKRRQKQQLRSIKYSLFWYVCTLFLLVAITTTVAVFFTILSRDHWLFFFWWNLYVCFANHFGVFVFQGQSIGIVEMPLRIRNNCILYIRFLFFGWFSIQHSFVKIQLRRLQNIDMVYID